MKVIEVKNLTKEFKVKRKVSGGFWKRLGGFFAPKYNIKVAVNNISFNVEEGEAVAFIGPNGAGKSTTIKMMTGILYPTSGEVSVLGHSPNKERQKLSYKIGSVIGQKEQLWIHLSPYDNFKFFGNIFNIPKTKLAAKIDELVKLFELSEFLHQTVKSLSLGQRMKCEMVASLLHEPRVLFFDEPTIGLDIVAKETMRALIKKINKELKTTIIFTSHDVGDIEDVCKRVIIINNGEIMLDDSMKNLKYRYLNKKIVEVKFNKEIDFKETTGFKIRKNNKTAYEIEVDMTKTNIDKLLKMFNADDLLDISISSTPLEEIIKNIYKG